MRLKQGIAIAGTHGKTTTTSLTGMVLTEAGFDPTIVVGGQVRILGTNARLGKGDFLVAEADEYDRSFLELTPVVAVLTNIEADHLDTYRDLSDILESFTIFANRVPFYGAVVACVDDPGVAGILPRIKRRVVTYGESPAGDAPGLGDRRSKRPARPSKCGKAIRGRWARSGCASRVSTTWPTPWPPSPSAGSCPIPFPVIARALAEFTGVVRRFETKGERDGVLVVDDYAHHPTEIAATLAAARQVYPRRRLVALFQPHLYSRTRDFAEDFGRALCRLRRGRRHGRLSVAGEADSRRSPESSWPPRHARPGMPGSSMCRRKRRLSASSSVSSSPATSF